MAMNKAERAAMEKLEQQVARLRALHFTSPVPPDLYAAHYNHEAVVGWFISGHAENGAVVAGSSRVHVHYRFNDEGIRSGCGTQGAKPMYSTRANALRGLRNEVEEAAARRLAAIDAALAIELANPTIHPIHRSSNNG